MSQLYRPEETYAGNLIGTLEALDSGITTLLDWSHNLNTPEHSDAALDALEESGSRVVFGHGAGFAHWAPVSALDHPADDARRLREGRLSSDDGLVTLCLAPRGNQFATLEVTARADSFGMTPLNNPIGAFVYNAHPGLVDTILVDGKVVKRDGKLLGVDHARVRRLAIESRDDILRRAEGRNGARLGGDWIPKAYQAVEAG